MSAYQIKTIFRMLIPKKKREKICRIKHWNEETVASRSDVYLACRFICNRSHAVTHCWMSSSEKSRRLLHVTLQRPVTLNTSDIQKVFRWQHISAICGTHTFPRLSGFGGLEVACWPLVPKFAGSNPAEAVGFFRAKKSSVRLPSEGK